MELLKKTVSLADDRQIIVCEADATFDARMGILVTRAQAEAGEDPVFDFFYLTFYPVIAACSRGDVPDPKSAYALPPEKLDEWYKTVWELNQDILGPYQEDHQVIPLTLRCGNIEIHETHDLPSYVMRLVRLEVEAQTKQDVPEEERTFRSFVYPKIAACSNGQIPSADDAIKLPRVDITAWAAYAMSLNGTWFKPIFDEAEREAQEAEKEKKKRGRRAHRKADTTPNQATLEEFAADS